MTIFNRRNFMKASGVLVGALLSAGVLSTNALAADYPTSKVNTTGLAVTDDTVTVGILHSATGTMSAETRFPPTCCTLSTAVSSLGYVTSTANSALIG